MTVVIERQIKNSFIYLLPIIVKNILPFISLPILTRILTKEDYGILALVNIFAIFASGLAHFGMTLVYQRNSIQYYNDNKKKTQLLYSSLLFVLLNFIILAVITLVFRATFSKLLTGTTEHGGLLFSAYCAHFFYGISIYYLTYFRNVEKASKVVSATIASGVMHLVLSIFFVACLHIGIKGIVYSHLISGFLIFTILTAKFIRTYPLSFSRSILIESLKISYPLTPRIFLGVIGTQFQKYMIGLLATIGGVGIYYIGQRISELVFTFMTALQNVFNPQVYKEMFSLSKSKYEYIGKYLTPFVYFSILLGLLIALFSEEVIHILTPKSYHGAIEIIIILSMYYGFLFFGKINGIQLIFMKKAHITSLLTLLSILTTVGLSIPFIIKYGALGAAWSALLSGVISGSITFLIAQHYYPIKWEYKNIGYIFAIFICSSILILVLRDSLIGYPYRLLAKCASVSCYFYLGIRLRIISVKNYLIIKRIILNKQRILTIS